MSKVLDLENRKKIYNLILNYPGLNLSEISKLLKFNVALVNYHTRFLEENEFINSIKEDGFKRFYISGEIGTKDKKLLGLLRQEIPLKIVLFLLEHPCSQHKEILKNFNLAASTLTYHLNKLVKSEIIFLTISNDKRVYVVKNEKDVVAFLIRYKPSEILKRFKDTWTDFSIP